MIPAFYLPVLGQAGSDYINMPPVQFREELSMVNNAIIIDVREVFEFRRSRLPGAVNMPSIRSFELSKDTLPPNAYLFLYCTTGSRSETVAARFIEAGFLNVYNLDGGIRAWRKKGFPVDRRKVSRQARVFRVLCDLLHPVFYSVISNQYSVQ